jgi:hypothetical protein
VSVTAPPPSGAAGSAGTAPSGAPQPVREACPLCGSPLHPEQEWCLSCGAAARTRLAASPGWRGPILALVVVLVLALGVLAGSLVKLAGPAPTAATQTTTVTTAAAAVTTTAPSGLLPQTATTPTIPTGTQRDLPKTSTTRPPTGGASAPGGGAKAGAKAKGPLGGLDPTRLKKTAAERLSKLGLTGK